MSIPPDSPWRGCAAHFPQPVSENDERAAQSLVEAVYHFNCRIPASPLAHIEYRNSDREEDILRHVFRWDITPYQDVFLNGFQSRRQVSIGDEVYYNLDHYVHHSGRPLDSRRPATHAFVSTSLNSGWHPSVDPGTTREVYRYEIYAPGGIWVAQTLGDRYRYPSQDEVCFVAVIAPQYILSAQLFRLTREAHRRCTRRVRVNNILRRNGNYNPQSHPSRLLNIRRPVFDYWDPASRRRRPLIMSVYLPCAVSEREKRQAYCTTDSDTSSWYARDVAYSESYINAAFRSSRTNEAYLFMENEYVKVNYAPGTYADKVLYGPALICSGYQSLTGTAFAEHGIDCAFGSHNKDEAFIFSGNLCAQINYAPGTSDDYIIKGRMTITTMFPFFEHTAFQNGVDAAFEATTEYEAYLFKEDKYALINYGSKSSKLIHVKIISEGFPALKDTIFKSGIEAAFASHRTDEAYLFKGDCYVCINFARASKDGYSMNVGRILSSWPSLRGILPRKNRGLDVHDYTSTKPDDDRDRDHDEL